MFRPGAVLMEGYAAARPPMSVYMEEEELNSSQTELVDVYLLRPEEPRAIELKDFTIMRPKNNRMHRLLRYYPRCEIAYRAAPPPPPEERIVTSPRGTTTSVVVAASTQRHNGGFSNPSRNAEVFRLKRQLLDDYYAAMETGSDPMGQPAADFGGARKQVLASSINELYYRNQPRSRASPIPQVIERRQLPKYERGPLGDEETIQLTSEREKPMTLDERLQYVDSLWPSLAPTDEDEEIMQYYGIEVQIISEEERALELEKVRRSAGIEETKEQPKAPEPEKPAAPSTPIGSTTSAQDTMSSPEIPELTVETRSATLQKQKEAEGGEKLVKTTKQDDWVQCDKCQKWRRLPNHVNVSELPATWYCKMNRWDKRFNKCAAPEEKVTVLMKESELIEYRRRRFTLDFFNRVKRMEKSIHTYKYDAREDDGERKWVQCVHCLKKRPLLGGMDPRKIGQPFVCWMNWDELHASCSAPQGPLLPRITGPDEEEIAAKSGATSTNNSSGKAAAKISGAGGAGGTTSETKKTAKGGQGNNTKKVIKRKPQSGDKGAGARNTNNKKQKGR